MYIDTMLLIRNCPLESRGRVVLQFGMPNFVTLMLCYCFDEERCLARVPRRIHLDNVWSFLGLSHQIPCTTMIWVSRSSLWWLDHDCRSLVSMFHRFDVECLETNFSDGPCYPSIKLSYLFVLFVTMKSPRLCIPWSLA